MFDPRLALTFVSVAETLSFTRTAEQLAVAQPWVSEQIRRLEQQLGFRLLDRTSRRVEITPDGRAFLPYARAMVQANDAAQRFVRERTAQLHHSLRIGISPLVSDMPERTELVDRFVQAYPTVQLNIQVSSVAELIYALKQGELDVVIAYATSVDPAESLETVPFCARIAHLLAPAEHPLATLKAAPLSALRGQVLVSSPGRADPIAFQRAFAPFFSCGAEIQPAPESRRTTIEHYAQIRRLICLRWNLMRTPRFPVGDMVCLPIDSPEPPTLHSAILRQSGPVRPVVERFCALGRALNAEGPERLERLSAALA
ncbi:MAG: LysR family transcriptional regulator [Caulobacteraceae bacterium]|nr:LysR family transcriptional regulator [Caulobacteraceae bacterium]